jgi:hypothetical protein
VTSKKEFNLQIQANSKSSITSVRIAAPRTVAGPVLIGEKEEVTAEEVRERFHKANLLIDTCKAGRRTPVIYVPYYTQLTTIIFTA